MTKTAKVVIGANYGDEGKGLTTDAICAAASKPIVIRFNGGAQAGHTVCDPDRRRHVFSHFGSGSLQGIPTFLSRFFVVLPRIFVYERSELERHGENPQVICDPRAQVTTPYDVGINRAIEEARGAARHGSVGIGFGETIERAENGYGLTVQDLTSEVRVREVLAAIARDWLPRRLAKLGLPTDNATLARVASPAEISRWQAETAFMMTRVSVSPITTAITGCTPAFEGAQGLLLDMERGHSFPFVTRSNTGLKNVLALAIDAGIDQLDVTYMTRAYLTRHGAGPLPNELAALDFAEIVDPTNRPNPWQGTLRFAPLDLDVLREAIAADLSDAASTALNIKAALGISCVDQIRKTGVVFRNGTPIHVPRAALSKVIAEAAGLPLAFESWGPTREDLHEASDHLLVSTLSHANTPALMHQRTPGSISPC